MALNLRLFLLYLYFELKGSWAVILSTGPPLIFIVSEEYKCSDRSMELTIESL